MPAYTVMYIWIKIGSDHLLEYKSDKVNNKNLNILCKKQIFIMMKVTIHIY